MSIRPPLLIVDRQKALSFWRAGRSPLNHRQSRAHAQFWYTDSHPYHLTQTVHRLGRPSSILLPSSPYTSIVDRPVFVIQELSVTASSFQESANTKPELLFLRPGPQPGLAWLEASLDYLKKLGVFGEENLITIRHAGGT